MARDADKLHGEADAKLQSMIKTVRGLVSDGYNPILFCRFIPTAEYLAEHLRQSLTGALRGVEVTASPACCLPPSASSASPRWARPTSASWSPPTA